MAGSDYQSISGSLTFNPGQTQKTVTVLGNGDTLAEGNETFFVNLTSVTGGTFGRSQANGAIVNDDHAPLAIAGPDQTNNEGDTVAFDASGSSDADGDALTFSWSFGDGGQVSARHRRTHSPRMASTPSRCRYRTAPMSPPRA